MQSSRGAFSPSGACPAVLHYALSEVSYLKKAQKSCAREAIFILQARPIERQRSLQATAFFVRRQASGLALHQERLHKRLGPRPRRWDRGRFRVALEIPACVGADSPDGLDSNARRLSHVTAERGSAITGSPVEGLTAGRACTRRAGLGAARPLESKSGLGREAQQS